jgi:FtsP/CotA-like multicopper oxidase with cupredoxin domain
MDTTTAHSLPMPTLTDHPVAKPTDAAPIPVILPEDVSRRRFLRTAAIAGGGLVAASVVACAPASTGSAWSYGPSLPPAASAGAPVPSAAPSMDHGPSAAPSGSASPAGSPGPSASTEPPAAIPAGWSDHDVVAKTKVDRFLAAEYDDLPAPNAVLKPKLDGDVKVFELTIDEIEHRIDAQGAPLAALGFNAVWTGPQIRVVEGDRIRAVFKNNLKETTGVHFHGQDLPNAVDGVPMITQEPIVPGATYAYEFVAGPSGSHMYHSHHNATDQVGRGLLGAFIVEPRDPADRPTKLYGTTQDIVWISNDTLGGFTINGRGFPATYPIVAQKGEKVLIRFMNEGVMTHPWHLHGQPMRVVARDGYPLGGAAFTCDTLGVNPGERWDVVVDCKNPGVWAFHCHILTHAEGTEGMFGMVTALIVQDGSAAIEVLPSMASLAAGRTAKVPFVCPVPATQA